MFHTLDELLIEYTPWTRRVKEKQHGGRQILPESAILAPGQGGHVLRERRLGHHLPPPKGEGEPRGMQRVSRQVKALRQARGPALGDEIQVVRLIGTVNFIP